MSLAYERMNEHEKINFFSFYFLFLRSKLFLATRKKNFVKISPKWNCVERWNFHYSRLFPHKLCWWRIDFQLDSFAFFMVEKWNEWNFPIFSRFPEAFQKTLFIVSLHGPGCGCVGESCKTQSCLRHHQTFLQLKCAESVYLPCAASENFQVSEKMLVGEMWKGNFSFFVEHSERSYISLRPGQVVLSASRVWKNCKERVCGKPQKSGDIKWWSITVQNGNHFRNGEKWEKTFRQNVIKKVLLVENFVILRRKIQFEWW